MHKPVCVKCEVEMKCEKVGVLVVEMYLKNKEVYRIWHADKYKCRVCGVEVMSAFAQQPQYTCTSEDCKGVAERMKKVGMEIVYSKEVI